MAYIQYETKVKPQSKTLEAIETINRIISEYLAAGYRMTLRMLYYQLVSRDLIVTENTINEYKRIGNIVALGRNCGLIDWQALEDRHREYNPLQAWESPAEILEAAALSYKRNLWETQDYYLEIWTEKNALIDVIERPAHRLYVNCYACIGYNSATAMKEAADRFIEKYEQGKNCALAYLGDHDPSGTDMSRDVKERLEYYGAKVKIERLALNVDQIKRYNPPPQPAKKTDTRYNGYAKKYGDQSWELDALSPDVLDGLITDFIEIYLDRKLYDQAKEQEERERAEIYRMIP
jgi:hypothetical protein